MSKNNDSEYKKFEEYFQKSIDTINEELRKNEEYQKIVDKELEKFTAAGAMKGVSHYIIENVKNGVAISAQKQSLAKDLFTIQKAALDYSIKSSGNEQEQSLSKLLLESINMQRKNLEKKDVISEDTDEDLDRAIENELSDDN